MVLADAKITYLLQILPYRRRPSVHRQEPL